MGGASIIVNLAGPSSGTTPVEYPIQELVLMGHYFRGPEMILAPVSTATAALDAGTPATSQTNRTRLNFTTAAPAWTTNELRGYFVRIKRNGALQFPEMPIAENDGDHLWVNTSSLASDVLATDTVEIVRPGAKIVGTNTTFGFPLLQVSGQSGAGFNGFCSLEKVEVGDFASFKTDTVIQIDRVRGVCPYAAVAIGRFSFINTIFLGSLDIVGASRNDYANPRQDFASGKFVDLLIVGGGLTVGTDEETGSMVVQNDISVYDNPSGPGIRCVSNGSFIMASKNTATLQGDGSSSVGIWARRGGRVRVNSTASKTTITGAGGDLRVGNGVAISYGTGVGEFNEALGWNGNFTRVLEGTATAPLGDTSQIDSIF